MSVVYLEKSLPHKPLTFGSHVYIHCLVQTCVWLCNPNANTSRHWKLNTDIPIKVFSTHTHTRTHACTNALTHIQTHTHAHTHLYTHMHFLCLVKYPNPTTQNNASSFGSQFLQLVDDIALSISIEVGETVQLGTPNLSKCYKVQVIIDGPIIITKHAWNNAQVGISFVCMQVDMLLCTRVLYVHIVHKYTYMYCMYIKC